MVLFLKTDCTHFSYGTFAKQKETSNKIAKLIFLRSKLMFLRSKLMFLRSKLMFSLLRKKVMFCFLRSKCPLFLTICEAKR